MDESKQHMAFNALLAAWVVAALIFAFLTSRLSVVIVIPIAVGLWCAANAVRLKQNTQLVLPVLLLPGALISFVGMAQSFGYGRMSDEPATMFVTARAIFFIVGLLLHLYAMWCVANESRASDHQSGERADRI